MKAALLLIAPLLIACGDPKPLVCQHDASDIVVDDAYCYDDMPGFEWDSGEPDTVIFIPPFENHSKTSKPKTTTSKPKPTATVRKTF